MTPNPQDILKLRAQLMGGQNQGLPQVQTPVAPQVSPQGSGDPRELPFVLQNTVQSSESTPQTISPREQALGSYREALQTPAPSQSDYHPSLGRRILGSLIGGASAFDPNYVSKSPTSQLGHDFVYAPFDKSMSDYQKKLAQKKEAYETESGAELGEAKLGETQAQKQAEVARAGAEEARKKGEEFKVSPEGLKARLEQLKVTHPGTPKESKLYNVTLANGKNVTATRNASGQLMFGDTPLGEDAYDASTLREVGTTLPKDPKEAAEKNANEYNDFVIGMKAKHPNMPSDEIAEAWKDKEAQISSKYEKAPQTLIVNPETGNFQRAAPGTKAPEGFETANQTGADSQGTTQTRTMIEAAPKVIGFIDKIEPLIDKLNKSLGPGPGRFSEFMAGKIGVSDPEFTKLRTDVMLLQSTLMRMHTGRGSEYMMKHFKELIDHAKQSPENMKAALGEIKDYAQSLKKKGTSGSSGGEAKTENVINYVEDPKTGKLVPESK